MGIEEIEGSEDILDRLLREAMARELDEVPDSKIDLPQALAEAVTEASGQACAGEEIEEEPSPTMTLVGRLLREAMARELDEVPDSKIDLFAQILKTELSYMQEMQGEKPELISHVPVPAELIAPLTEMALLMGRAGEREGPETDSALRALQRAYVLWANKGRLDHVEQVILEAECDIEDVFVRDILEALRGGILFCSGQPAKAISTLFRVLDRPGTSDEACVVAAVGAVAALAVSGRAEQAVAMAEHWMGAARRLATEHGMVGLTLAGRLVAAQTGALCLAGRLDEAESLATRGHQKALAHKGNETIGAFAFLLGRIALARGQVEVAERWLEDAATRFGASTGLSLLPWCRAALAWTAALKGDLKIAETELKEAQRELTPRVAFIEPEVGLAEAWTAAARRDLADACTIAIHVADRAEESEAYAFVLLASHEVVRFGGASTVAVRLRNLTSICRGPLASTYADHAEALAAGNGGRLDQVSEAFEALGAQLLAAEAAAEAAAAYRKKGENSSMVKSSIQAWRLLEGLEGIRTPALSELLLELLTDRQREVLLLAERGLSGSEIAQKLVLSPRTVKSHLQKAYEKLCVQSAARVDLDAI